MRGSEIPQANLDHVRAVLVALHEGVTSTGSIARDTEISPRLVAYALVAGRSLGWVSASDLTLTELGAQVLATAAHSSEERELIVRSIRASPTLQRFASQLLDPEERLEELERLIVEHSELSPATAARRVSTLLAWRRRIIALDANMSPRSAHKIVSTRRPSAPSIARRKATSRRPGARVDVVSKKSSAPPLLLSRVVLERFKAAWQPGPIELQPMTVVIGRNGAGKSTLLEALQWVDKTMRDDARRACERYYGVRDLINLRTQLRIPHFELSFEWCEPSAPRAAHLFYHIKVRAAGDRSTPEIVLEEMYEAASATAKKQHWIEAQGNIRTIHPLPGAPGIAFTEPDRLALGRGLGLTRTDEVTGPSALERLQDFWSRAVFLRLSPNRLAQSSPARRKSFEPMLDEEGQNLPALLNELTSAQRRRLVETLQLVLQDIKDVEVSEPTIGRDEQVFYSLKEQMPYRGRAGESLFPIPAWMLSEGTRRITALFALLVHDPAPSLLCVEEIENGLDPWTLRTVLQHLKSVSERGTQVIVTTHSPWLLDHVELASILHVHRTKGETKYERFADRKSVTIYQGRVPAGAIYVREEPGAEDEA